MTLLRVVLLALVTFAAPALSFAQATMALGATTVRFATLTEAREEMAREDDWMRAAGEFQRSAMMNQARPVGLAEFREHLARSALPWTLSEERRWRAAVEALQPKFTALRVRLPATVLLVLNDGSADRLPHTRGNAVFLPAGFSERVTDADLMAHEFFHVLSRHDPELATRIYALFGFEAAAPLEWPAAWDNVRLANPDAPVHRHAIELEEGGRRLRVMPVLVARRTQLEPGETIMNVLDVRLLVLAPPDAGASSRAVMVNGEPQWLPALRTASYLDRTGRNTGYVFHPEEIAADNFMLLASGRPARNPGLLQQLEALLRAADNQEEKK